MQLRRVSGGILVTAALSTAAWGPATAGGPSDWTKLDTDVGSSLSHANMGRSSDGALHAVWVVETSPTSEDYHHVRITANGVLGAVDEVLATDADTLVVTPKILRSGTGVRLVFSGRPEDTFLTSTAPAAGTPWTAPALLGDWLTAYGTYGLGADTRADGTVVVGGALNPDLYWHQGLDPNTGNEQTQIAGASILHSNLAVDRADDSVWMVFYDQNQGQTGIYAVQVEPAVGTKQRGPKSVNRDGLALGPSQQVPLVAADDGGLYTAYCTGYPFCTAATVWEIGTNRTVPLPRSANVSRVTLGPGRNGRIWAAWVADNRLWAARSDPGVTRFGNPIDLGAPPGSAEMDALGIDGVSSRADIIVNAIDSSSFTSDMWHIRALPTLSLRASPKRFDGDNATEVTFTVTDAGQPVNNAKVRVAGKRCFTEANGQCTITIGPRDPGRPLVSASKRGYAPATTRLTIRQ